MSELKGRIISKSDAEKEINQYLDIRRRTYDEVVKAVKTAGVGDDALTYFSDKEVAFFFDFSLIQKLQDAAGADANGVLVFYAAAPSDDSSLGIKQGSTTVVAVPVNITSDTSEIKDVSLIIKDVDNAAVEYPGGFVIDDITKTIKDLSTFKPDRTSNFQSR
jgi:hypothetical protein